MNNIKREKNGIINGALSLTLSAIIVKVLGLVYKVPLSYILSDEGMGYFNTAYTVFSFFYIICTSGVPKAISILVSEAEGDGDADRITQIYSTAFKIFFLFGLIVSVAFFVLAAPISSLIGNRSAYYSMALISPSIVFVCASGVIRGYFNGRLKFLPIAISELISGASKLVLGLALAYLAKCLGYGYEVISGFTIFGITLGSFFGFAYLYFKKHSINDNKTKQKSKISPILTKRILKIAIPLTLTSAIGSISSIIDLTIIMQRLRASGATELQAAILYGNYTTLAIPMLNLVATLTAPLSAVLLPLVSKGKNSSSTALLSEQISIACKVMFFVTVPISVLFLFRSGEILSLIFEDSSAIMAAPLLSLIAPGIVFMSLLTLINSVIEGLGNTRTPMVSLIIASAVKLSVSYIMIGKSEYGLLGASIGTTVSYFVGMCISLFYLLIAHKIKLNAIKDFLILLISALISMGISGWLVSTFIINTILTSLIEFTFFGIIYIFILFLFGFLRLKELNFMSKMYKKPIK